MSIYKFWGIKSDDTRDLLGMCHAESIGMALSCWPSVVSSNLPDYPKVEIVLSDGVYDIVDEALRKLPKLRAVK